MKLEWFWQGWEGPLRVACLGLLAYGFLIILLRATGKRTLSKMNAFDFVITVASGSTFAAVLLNKQVSYAEGVTAFTTLVLMQYGVAWASSRSNTVEGLVKSVPSVLVWRGEMQLAAMAHARVTESEVHAACRQHGVTNLADVDAMVLETAGEFSVLTGLKISPRDSYCTLRGTELPNAAKSSGREIA
jgi:uncharacterized membrane protein YcaP (DUF421 family)